MKPAVNVAITGAAGQIGYALAFRVASGQMLGADTPINLHLLEVTPALPQLAGVVMELNDCAFPTLNKIVATDDARVAFKDCQAALLVGARPRGPGMERKDLLMANAQIFSAQGKAMNEVADRNIRVLVVGNPANTNAMIARANAQGPEPAQLHRDDAPRSQPRRVAAGREDRQPRDPHPQDADLGQPLLDAVSGPQLLHRRRQAGALARGPQVVRRHLHPHRAAARRRHHQGARRVVGGLGRLGGHRSHARLASGNGRGQLHQHGRAGRRQLRHPRKAWCIRTRSPAPTANTRSCRASTSTSSRASAWTPPTRSCAKSVTASRS